MRYKVEVRGADWRDRKKDAASLLVSVGQPYCEGAKLEAALEWIDKNFSKCFIDLADTLQRYNYIALQCMEESKADISAFEAGNKWMERNLPLLSKLSIPFEIRRWNAWREHKDFPELLIAVHELYATDSNFKVNLDMDIKGFIERRQADGQLQDQATAIRMAENCLKFITEEIVASIIIGRICPASVIYNAKELSSYKSVRLQETNLPVGLENLDYIRITFRSLAMPSVQLAQVA